MAKKLLCVLMSVLMIVSLLPMGVSASASDYNYIYVNGIDILTATNYTVECGEGTAVFNPSTDTLTLTNATITCYPRTAGSTSYYGIYVGCTNNMSPSNGFTLELVGDNTIVADTTGNNYAVYSFYCPLTITSTKNGTLTADGMYHGLRVNNRNFSISDCTISLTNTTYAGLYVSGNYTLDITNSTVTITGTKYGIYGAATYTFTDSAIDITTTGTDQCIYNTQQTKSATTSAFTVDNSQLTCTSASGTPAIEACGFTVTGNSTVIADGGINLAIGSSTNYNKYAHVIMSTEPAYFYYGSDASNLSTLGTSTSARSYTGSTVATTYGYSKYPYIKIVTGTGNGGPTPAVVSEDGISSGFRMIYVNEEYHAMIIDRVVNGGNHRFFISMPHVDDNGDGYCDVCKEYVGESEAEIITIDGVDYEVTYSKNTDIVAGNWSQVTLDSDTSLMDALAEDGAILMITRSKEVSVSYANEEYEKFLFIDSWWSNNNTLITLGSAGHTSADESDVIDCLSDDGTTLTYDGATIYAAWVDGGYADGGESLVFISNTSASYTITSFKVLVPVA